MKLYNLLQIRKILNNHIQDKMSTSLAYKIMKFMKGTEEDETFYNDKLRDIIQEYSEKDAEGQIIQDENGVKIDKEKAAECNGLIQDLYGTEVDLPHVTFSIKELEPLELTVSDLYVLDDCITE